MLTQNLFLQGENRPLKAGTLLAMGGEGAIYGLGADHVVKIFHKSEGISIEKLDLLIHLLTVGLLPPSVLGPRRIVMDANQLPVGYLMPRLPSTAVSLKQLCNLKWQQLNGISPKSLLGLFGLIYRDLNRLHQAGVVVGDFNDLNLFIDGHTLSQIYWLDVDSFQIGRFPCLAAHPAFLDPFLYGEADLAAAPAFSPASDRYAFAVHLAKGLTGVHPYGGIHTQVKSLTDRAARRLSFFDPDIKLPPFARPPHKLPSDFQTLLRQYFVHGQRPEFKEEYFDELKNVGPPDRRRQPLLRLDGTNIQSLLGRELKLVTYQQISAQRWQAIVFRAAGQTYGLCTGGRAAVLSETPLFSGSAGISFFFIRAGFGMWSPDGCRVLIFACQPSGRRPKLAATLPLEKTGRSLDGLRAAAATDTAFYRLTQGVILRGTLSEDGWVEEIVGTSHRQNSAVWGDPDSDLAAILHHLWGEFRLWLRWPDGSITETPADTALRKKWSSLSISDIERHLRRQNSLTPL